MAIATSSSRCFDAVSNALQAVKHGNASQAALILHSVKSDALLMRNGMRRYQYRLQRTEGQIEEEVERLTREMNDLYQQEQPMRRRERELKGLVQQLQSQNERNVESRNEAQRRYQQASEEERRCREKRELHKVLFFIPIVNIFAAIAEWIQENGENARRARAEMERYERRIEEENDDIRRTNSQISDIQTKIGKVQREAQILKQKRDSCQEKLGAVKKTSAVVLDAIQVSSEILNLTDSAKVKTESLERVMRLASKKNTLKILRSDGIKTKVVSFKENWDEIADTVQSSSLLRVEQRGARMLLPDFM